MQVELGKIVGVWGVKGWVKLHSYTRNRADIAGYSTWWLKEKKSKEAERFSVLACREQGPGVVAQLERVESREQAELLIGRTILVEQSEFPKLPKGEFYWHELIGLQVSNTEGVEIGTVSSILETGANDVLVIKREDVAKTDQHDARVVEADSSTRGAEVLIPYVGEIVLEVDLAMSKMLVDWDPDYLLD
jgi:16S rRNA processing protein RimM